MLKAALTIFLIFVLSLQISIADEFSSINLLENSQYFDDEYQMFVPWNGQNSNSVLLTVIDLGKVETGHLFIKHPPLYALFADSILIYRNRVASELTFEIDNLKKKFGNRRVQLIHDAEYFNRANLKVELRKQSVYSKNDLLYAKEKANNEIHLSVMITLILFLIVGLIKALLPREFDFYFSGVFLTSPRLTIDKFLGDSINPFLLLLAAVFVSLILLTHIIDIRYFSFSDERLLGFRIDSTVMQFILVLIATAAFLIFKRFAYLIFFWLKQEMKDFSSLWRTYLLSFSNLCFWYFIIFSVPTLLLPNFEFGNFFQILFFIFAALNAVGGIMVYTNFKLNMSLFTIAGLFVADILPVILIVHFLTF